MRSTRVLAASVTLAVIVVVAIHSSAIENDRVFGTQVVVNLYIVALLPLAIAFLQGRLRPLFTTTPVVIGKSLLFVVVLVATLYVLSLSSGPVRGAAPAAPVLDLALYVGTTMGQSLIEELVFRIGLPLLIASRFVMCGARSPTIVVLSSIGFVTWHVTSSPVAALDHFLFALLMFELLDRAGTIVAPVVAHVVNNVVTVTVIGTGATSGLLFSATLLIVKYALLFCAVAIIFGGPARPSWATRRTKKQIPHEPGQESRIASLDILRGVALLVIMIENMFLYLPPDNAAVAASTTDRVTRTIFAWIIEFRGLPLFSLLLGFGTFILLARDRGSTTVRRRGWAFVLIGSVHGLYVFAGDILAVYGLLLLVIPRLVRSTRLNLLVGITGALLVLQMFIAPWLLGPRYSGGLEGSMLDGDWAVAAASRPWEWLSYFLSTPLVSSGYLFYMLVGFVTARWLSERHRALPDGLVRWGPIAGGITSLALSAPHAVLVFHTYGGPPTFQGDVPSIVLAQLAGALSACSIWLLIAGRRPAPAASSPARDRTASALQQACVANGRRSLSGYLTHSAVLLLALPAYGLGLAWSTGLPVLVVLTVCLWLHLGWHRPVDVQGPAEGFVRSVTTARGPVNVPAPAPTVDRRSST